MQTYFTAEDIYQSEWIKNPEDINGRGGVYLVTDRATKKLLYIGQSKNLTNRLYPSIHLLYRKELHNLYVIYEPIAQERKWMEYRFIELLKPPMNKRGGMRVETPPELAQEYYDKIFNGLF